MNLPLNLERCYLLQPRLRQFGLVLAFVLVLTTGQAASADQHPNIIFILADDLGYGDLGCYGQKIIKTPNLDRMADEGMRFTQFYAGSTVCAPSRCVLMTGYHTGHAQVRGNAGRNNRDAQTLRDSDITVAEVLRDAGYDCALIGKWGLGESGSQGHPLEQGFNYFFGYLNQQHAHNYYPEYLWRGTSKQLLRNVLQPTPGDHSALDFVPGAGIERVDYSHDLFMDDAIRYVQNHSERPFFLYLALTLPHANNEGTRLTGNGAEVPEFGQYADSDWSEQDKGQAAMISRMDNGVGEILRLLDELNIAEKTLVFFTSDNGPHDEAGHDLNRFRPAGELRAIKRSLYEGGIRVPAIAWMPGTVPAGKVSDHVSYMGDFMSTACDLTGASLPKGLDSISMLPTLTGREAQQNQHDYLYWEFYEQKSRQAVRFGEWKAIREPMLDGSISLFNLSEDASESHNLASKRPEIVAEARKLMEVAHHPHSNWLAPGK